MTDFDNDKVLVSAEVRTGEHRVVTITRRAIAFFVALVILGLGVPWWWSTTLIYRADLPVDKISYFAENLESLIKYEIPVYLDIPNSLDGFTKDAETALHSVLYDKYPDLENIWSIKFLRGAEGINDEENYIVRFEYVASPAEEDQQEWPVEAFYSNPFNKEIKLFITDAVVKAKKVDEFLAKVLIDNIFGEELKRTSKTLMNEPAESNIALPFSSNYKIVLTFLVENGKPVSWEIKNAVKLLETVTEKLQYFTSFTITSQIHYYSKLTFAPTFDVEKQSYVIKESDLSTFINLGDWNLVNHDIAPNIFFVIYFAASNYYGIPLSIENSDTNSFIVPQWGGAHILNKSPENDEIHVTEEELIPILETFTSQLFNLLGMPKDPKSPLIKVDILSRITILKNLKRSLENLKALIILTESLNEISIPESTRSYVVECLENLEASIEYSRKGRFDISMKYSSLSLEYSERAFFEKEIVQQAYFPSEHKMAVLLPLLGPVLSITTVGIMKTIKSMIAEYKQPKLPKN